ncbi:MAG: hypothetical protein QE271_09190 [Bacteriovoracaceae bacterium]|nr:hypothetical protein [Bacteriovoracaceae bacterium]
MKTFPLRRFGFLFTLFFAIFLISNNNLQAVAILYKTGTSDLDCTASQDISVFTVTPSKIKKCWFNFSPSIKPLSYNSNTRLEVFTDCSDCMKLLDSWKYSKTEGFSKKNLEKYFFSYLSNHYYKTINGNNTTDYAKCIINPKSSKTDPKTEKTTGFYYNFKQYNDKLSHNISVQTIDNSVLNPVTGISTSYLFSCDPIN